MQKGRKDKSFIKKPIYTGGNAAMRNLIRENLVYPKEALQKSIEGTVSLKYTIDHKGNVTDTHIIAGLGYGCDEEAVRLVRMFKFEVPKTRGVKVAFHKDIHVHFRLPKKKPAPQKPVTQYVYTSVSPATKPVGNAYSYTLTITTSENKKKPT